MKSRGEMYHIGLFDCVVEAGIARNRWLKENLGGLATAWRVRRANWRAKRKVVAVDAPERAEVVEVRPPVEAEAEDILAELERELQRGYEKGEEKEC